jgi:predicted AlkP superfamily phosphohydrolase/phosphomutase
MVGRAILPAAAIQAALLLTGISCSNHKPSPKMIVLGIDGMDPVFLENHWSQLPNLNRLHQEGDFKRLATTTPPQSPVAWSTFITGLNPDGHGIYDFIHADRATHMPHSSMAEARPGRKLQIGPYSLPITSDRIENQRRGTPFWQILSKAGVSATILRMPTDFPPIDCEAHSLAGMGTPDLLGTFGTFAFFTNRDDWQNRKLTGGAVFPVTVTNHHAELQLPGPVNTRVKIDAFVDPTESVARFDLEGHRVVLKQGELSDWIPVRFPLIPALADARGMIRIYAKELHPNFAVYVSPVNIDPRDPAMPISEPKSFSGDLAKANGAFYTQGMPYDTTAFRHGVFTRGEYRAHSREVSRQTVLLLHSALKDFREGILFFHFFGVDQDAHMLWGKYDDELLETYKLVDDMLGKVREKVGDATLIVMSDHGFAKFDRAVHLNTWLMREGFLKLTNPWMTGDDELFVNVDWSRTKAYALGLNSIYITEGEDTRSEIQQRLLSLRDPANGNQVVRTVVATHGGKSAPDLIVGYAPGYRGSWQTALGAVPGVLIEDNVDEWRGDHCVDPLAVPGVLLSNRMTAVADPRLDDLTVTILEAFGAKKGERMKGRNLYVR